MDERLQKTLNMVDELGAPDGAFLERLYDTAIRRRIIEATIELHSQGPATFPAIAQRAGVRQSTVARYFPDEEGLIRACTEIYFADRPPPDSGQWRHVKRPDDRLRLALTDLYRYFADNEPILTSAAANIDRYPALASGMAPFLALIAEARETLGGGWSSDAGPGSLLRGAIGHAVDFATWYSLTRTQGLAQSQAVELMVATVNGADAQKRGRPASLGSVAGDVDRPEPAQPVAREMDYVEES